MTDANNYLTIYTHDTPDTWIAFTEPAGEIVRFTPQGGIAFGPEYKDNPDKAAQAFMSIVEANLTDFLIRNGWTPPTN